MTPRFGALAPALGIACLLGCVEAPGAETDAGRPDAGSSAPDATSGVDASSGRDASTPAGGDVGGFRDERGFLLRVPQARDVPNTDPAGAGGTTSCEDLDYVCTLDDGTLHGFFYVQATPTENRGMPLGMVYRTEGGWLSLGNVVTAAENAEYDRGGNHAIDTVSFDLNGLTYRYYHSSLYPWYRPCHDMDCLEVYQGTSIVKAGCEPDRSLPVVCVNVEARDGAPYVPELVDTFATCPGDPRAADAGR
ncbi:MAG: hypothetical protein HY901_15385 [Deltaproteobacteria bacterium]|nr:hypothetical protein [Deltaproteobacteria bacterium]